MAETTRISLLERVRDLEDQEAWREFDALYRAIVTRYARFLGLRPEMADEAASQVMIRLMKRMPKFRYDRAQAGRFRAYIKQILRRVVIDMHQPQNQESVILSNLAVEHGELACIELEEVIKHCMAKLQQRAQKPARFEAFYRRVVQQQSVDEVCAALGMTREQVYQAKDDMLAALRKTMADCGIAV